MNCVTDITISDRITANKTNNDYLFNHSPSRAMIRAQNKKTPPSFFSSSFSLVDVRTVQCRSMLPHIEGAVIACFYRAEYESRRFVTSDQKTDRGPNKYRTLCLVHMVIDNLLIY